MWKSTPSTNAPQVAKTYLWDPSEPVVTRILHINIWNNGEEMESLYCTHDLQKNVTALFEQAAGRRAQYEYDPYGNLININGDAAGQSPFRYSNEYHDEYLSLIYYNYRHYNPADGRWINRDPIAERGGRNLYGFVNNRVSSFIDVLGLACQNKPKRRNPQLEDAPVTMKFDHPDPTKIDPTYIERYGRKRKATMSKVEHYYRIACYCQCNVETRRLFITDEIEYLPKIQLNRQQATETIKEIQSNLPGIYGHEQRYILIHSQRMDNVIKRLRNLTVEVYNRPNGVDCANKAKKLERDIREEFKEEFSDDSDHFTPDPRKNNPKISPVAPEDAVMYPPMPHSPRIR